MFCEQEVIIFPYSKDMFSVIEYYLLKGITKEKIKVFGYEGDFLIGEDIGVLDGDEKWEIYIQSNIISELGNNQIVYISQHDKIDQEKLYEVISRSIDNGNDVYCKVQLSEMIIKKIMRKNINCKEKFFYYPIQKLNEYIVDEKIFSFRMPVIYVAELIPEHLGAKRVSVYLKNKLEKEGYSPLSIGENEFEDELSIKQILSEVLKLDNLNEGILLFNHTVWNKIKKGGYDVIIIEPPDSLLRYDSRIVGNGFGIYTHLLNYAVPANYYINCLSCEVAKEGIKEINEMIQGIIPKCISYTLCFPKLIYEEKISEPIAMCLNSLRKINESSNVTQNALGWKKEMDRIFECLITDIQSA